MSYTVVQVLIVVATLCGFRGMFPTCDVLWYCKTRVQILVVPKNGEAINRLVQFLIVHV